MKKNILDFKADFQFFKSDKRETDGSKLLIKNYRYLNFAIEIYFNGKLVVIEPKEGSFKFLKNPDIILIDPEIENGPEQNSFFEIELQTIVTDNTNGKKWIRPLENGKGLVKERWIFKNGETPVREALNIETNEWSETTCYIAGHNSYSSSPAKKKSFARLLKRMVSSGFNNRIKGRISLLFILALLYYVIIGN